MVENVKQDKGTPSESDRLQKLREYDLIEECGPDQFEKIVQMASWMCDADYAGIHFIDESTQRCEVSYGPNLENMDRRKSVCQYTILNDDPLVVSDLRFDERFAKLEFVQDYPHFISYAGAPIKTPEGERIGTLCVLDTRPRDFTDDQVEALQMMAGEVINRLELYLRNKQLQDKKEQIEAYAEERDAMIKEIHHRLKNNLSYIIGILDLELMNSSNTQLQQLIKKIQKRIMSVATIHQRLYESDNLEGLDLKSYLEVLTQDIQASFSGETKQIECKVKGESISLNNKQMTPFGLLMSELLINSFKHAFEGRKQGTIEIQLERENGEYQIDVKDDGVGLPDDFNLEDPESMGSQLISSFLEQLNADIDWNSNNGTCFQITFAPA
jgi:two-component sensor histidine kinase